jgi:hypothetical protein
MRVVLATVAVAIGALALGGFAAPASANTQVTVTLTGSEPGRVVSVQNGIDCSNIPGEEKTDCTFSYPSYYSGITFVSSAGPGASLLSWGGDAGGTCVGGKPTCVSRMIHLDIPLNLEARFGPTPEPPVVSTGVASAIDFPSAHVAGAVNPNSNAFSLTECRFEYGPTTSYGSWAPCKPNVTTGVNMKPVAATLGVLEPDTTYHYRLKAATAGGAVVGDDATFTTGPARSDNCPNAVVRAQQGALGMGLPDCMAYELVSPPFTAGGRATTGVEEGGGVITLRAASGFAGVLNLPDLGVFYRADRTPTGWEATAIAPPARDFPYIGSHGTVDMSRDKRRSLWTVTPKADEGTNRWTPIVREEDGTFTVAGPSLLGGNLAVIGTSANLDAVVLWTISREPVLTDGTVDTRSTAASRNSLLVASRDDDGNLEVRQVAYRAGATMFPTCGAELGGADTDSVRAAISDDGSKIFFSGGGTPACRTNAANRRVWAKIGDADPIDLSETRCDDGNCGAAAIAIYAGAARDGSRVYFTTQQKLVNGDQDTSAKNDLYEYDFDAPGERLRPVTASIAPEGAGVLGVTRISDDGSHVYFVANGRPLAGPNARGVSPQVGDSNLYVYHREAGEAEGTTTFIGAVAAGELATVGSRRAKGSSDGRFLLFASTANLTGEKQTGDTLLDLYRYDARHDELRRIWTDDPEHNGPSRTAGVDFTGISHSRGSQGGMQYNWMGFEGRAISEDGATIVFATDEPLSPWDVNQVIDVYMWRANTGRLTLLSTGSAEAPTGVNRNSVTGVGGMSPSGDSVFLISSRALTPGGPNAQTSAYAVRVNGGFPDAPKRPVCVGDACQGPRSSSPGSPEVGTTKDSGSGNVPVTPRGVVSVRAPKAVRGARVVLRVKAPGKGRLTLSGASVYRSARPVARAGSYRIAVRLDARAARRLTKTGRLRAKVRVAFRPSTGLSSSKVVSVTFKRFGAKGGR